MGSLGRQFEWLWAAYGISALGTWLAFDAFGLVAIQVLHAGPGAVSGLAAAGLAVGAALAVPLGPWLEFRRKRPTMIAMDLLRFILLLSVPAAYALDLLTFGQLLIVSVLTAAADIACTAATGSYLKMLVPQENLLAANGRFESTAWTTTMLGPPLGGAAIALFGPVVTVTANAISFLLSAVGLHAIGGQEPSPPPRTTTPRTRDLLTGWHCLLSHPTLRPLLLNASLVNGLIMATAPLMAVLMLTQLGFATWQYCLAFAAPCLGGLLGSRLARPLVGRFGPQRVLRGAGALRACWLIGLPFVQPGAVGLLLVMVVELGLITCCGVFNPVLATTRLELLPADRVVRALSAWSITTKAGTAALTGLWGLIATLIGTRPALVLAGLLVLASPLLLPRRSTMLHRESVTSRP
ncbi:MFS transporter [Nocardia panacis]|uniref:MFS transporter n=1 Tax=Nocardia panacis TaxID=2340916 RepID=A0A3A4KK03_9NOCA|nr:MFS transporter [Nocardia panacis]RJO74130.1 MFS transporter [Nocardia panacis]